MRAALCQLGCERRWFYLRSVDVSIFIPTPLYNFSYSLFISFFLFPGLAALLLLASRLNFPYTLLPLPSPIL